MTDPLIILYEDTHCLAVAKPAGVLTPGTTEEGPTLESAVRQYLKHGDSGPIYLGTVHRLDRPVSGVVLWAKTPKAARRLAEQFSRREVRKEYWGIVEGMASIPEGTWDDWLGPVDATGRARVERGPIPGARRAITRFRRGRAIRLPDGCDWLRLWPVTGRTHQLRAQAAARGLPIRGDRAYGAAEAFPAGIALHARSLEVRHPILRHPITLRAPLPEAWSAAGIALA